jgi:hypothetical protein
MVNKQRGGIVSFVVVGVVLAGLLAGGLYLSKQQGREARTDVPAPQVAERDTDREEPASPTVRDETRPAETSEGAQNSGRDTAPATSQPSGTGTTRTDQRTDQRTDHVANTGPSDIPATGPAETMVTVIALVGLTFAAHRHFGSRRSRRAAALRQ